MPIGIEIEFSTRIALNLIGYSMLGSRKQEVSSSASGMSSTSEISIPGYSAQLSSATSSDWSSDAGHSLVDKHLTMRGDLESEGNVLVRGKVIGNIKCKMLVVDTDAQIEGGIEAHEIVVRGKAKGTIKADQVRLENTASVDCEIVHRVFSAEQGARIKGTLRILDDAEAENTKENLSLVA